jgi:hypothetical protein
MSAASTDVILVRCKLASDAQLQEAAQRFCREAGLQLQLQRAAWSPESHWTYVYAQLATPRPLDATAVPLLRRLWSTACPAAQEADVARLQRVQDIRGATPDGTPTRHYVVETDPEADWEDEIARWYVEEHLPGLAAVTGTVRAERFVNHDSGPRSHACYGLVGDQPFNSPPWLAVRGTEWSSRVRPHFTNTRRTMMNVVA